MGKFACDKLRWAPKRLQMPLDTSGFSIAVRGQQSATEIRWSYQSSLQHSIIVLKEQRTSSPYGTRKSPRHLVTSQRYSKTSELCMLRGAAQLTCLDRVLNVRVTPCWARAFFIEGRVGATGCRASIRWRTRKRCTTVTIKAV